MVSRLNGLACPAAPGLPLVARFRFPAAGRDGTRIYPRGSGHADVENKDAGAA